jgi:hypothetical protein
MKKLGFLSIQAALAWVMLRLATEFFTYYHAVVGLTCMYAVSILKYILEFLVMRAIHFVDQSRGPGSGFGLFSPTLKTLNEQPSSIL